MSKLGCIVYCNKEARRWEVQPSEGCITFVLCFENSKPVAMKSEAELDIQETVVLKPRPYVNSKLVAHDKLVSYPYSQLKEFVHAVPWKDDWGEGQFVSSDELNKKVSSKSSSRKLEKEKSTNKEGTKPDGSTSPRKEHRHHHKDKDKEKEKEKDEPVSPRKKQREEKEKEEKEKEREKEKEKEKSVSKSSSSTPKSPRREKTEKGEKSPREDRSPRSDEFPSDVRKVNIDLSKKDVPPSSGGVAVGAVEGLDLDSTTLKFLSEHYRAPLKLSANGQVTVDQSDMDRIAGLDSDLANLQRSVSKFNQPARAKASPFTDIGLEQYYGYDPQEGDLVVPPPNISLQGLDIGAGDDASSPRGTDAEPLIWQSGSLGLSKKAWYQLIGRSDDGVLSSDSLAFFKSLAKQAGADFDPDSERASLARSAVEAMDKISSIDSRVKKRLLEQADGASLKRKVSRSTTSGRSSKK